MKNTKRINNKGTGKPYKEIKAFVNKEITSKKGETTNKRINYLNVKTKEL